MPFGHSPLQTALSPWHVVSHGGWVHRNAHDAPGAQWHSPSPHSASQVAPTAHTVEHVERLAAELGRALERTGPTGAG